LPINHRPVQLARYGRRGMGMARLASVISPAYIQAVSIQAVGARQIWG
jgi:hypothetical protein